LDTDYIDSIKKRLPVDVSQRYSQMKKWGIPSDTFPYLLRNNLIPLLEKILRELEIAPKFAGTLLGHSLKHLQGQFPHNPPFSYQRVFELLKFLKAENLDLALAKVMLSKIYRSPRLDLESVLSALKFKKIPENEILDKVPGLIKAAKQADISQNEGAQVRWIMGQLHKTALGNIPLRKLKDFVENAINILEPRK